MGGGGGGEGINLLKAKAMVEYGVLIISHDSCTCCPGFVLECSQIFYLDKCVQLLQREEGDVMLNTVCEQVRIMAFAGFLACAMWLVPSANAVDALKTCTCLLKECR